MRINLLAETIDKWAALSREYEAAADQQGAERMRNWLFGAGMALQMLDDESLREIYQRALEESMNEHNSNRTLGADPGDDMGISGVDNQRQDLADGGAER